MVIFSLVGGKWMSSLLPTLAHWRINLKIMLWHLWSWVQNLAMMHRVLFKSCNGILLVRNIGVIIYLGNLYNNSSLLYEEYNFSSVLKFYIMQRLHNISYVALYVPQYYSKSWEPMQPMIERFGGRWEEGF